MTTAVVILPDRADLEELVKAALPAAAVAAVSWIQRRTAQGLDADGRRFAPYTSRYAADRALAGFRSQPVDLTLTGKMIENLKVKTPTSAVDSTFGGMGLEARIGFDGQHRDTAFRATGKEPAASGVKSGRGRRSKVLTRLPTTTPMATVVLANNARREFFGVRDRAGLASITRAFQRAMDEQIRKRNARAGQARLPARTG